MVKIRDFDAGTVVKTGMSEEISQCLRTVEIEFHRKRATNMWSFCEAEVSRI